MVDKDDALIREVHEELRREQWAKLWDRYGTYALGVALALIAVMGGYRVWEAKQLARSEAAGAEYTEALRLTATGKADEAAKKLESLATSGPGGYAALAELQRAGSLLKSSRPADALAVFEKISKDGAVESMLRDFASIQAATLRLGEADFTEMQNRLTPLKAAGNTWRHNAHELLGLAAIKAGKLDDARAALGALLGDPETPQGALERARVMLGSIAASELAKAAGDAAAPAAAATAPASAPAAAGPAGGSSSGTQPK